MSDNNQRSRLVIEPEIQYSLVWQLCQQWFLHLVASLMLLTMLQVLLGGFFRPWSEHVRQIWPMLASLTVSMLFLLPVYIRSSLKLSNRFVGPIHRFRHVLRGIADGKQYQPMQFRESDFWPAISKELDAAVNVLTASQSQSADASLGGNLAPGGGVVFPADGTQNPDAPTS